MICASLKGDKIHGFCLEEFNGKEMCQSILENGGLLIDKELWEYLIPMGFQKFKGVKEDKLYTIYDKEMFEKSEDYEWDETEKRGKNEIELIKETLDKLVVANLEVQ